MYIYVDGESHYMRTLAAFRSVHGEEAELTRAQAPSGPTSTGLSFPNTDAPPMMVSAGCSFFWDRETILFLQTAYDSGRAPFGLPQRAVWFSSATGDPATVHGYNTQIRRWGFEPNLIHEHKGLAKQRWDRAQRSGVLYKAKGVDIGLATRMVEDAHLGLYNGCWLFTSDADYLPAIQAVRRLGRIVYVCGYRGGIGERSPLEYVPDRFLDLTPRVEGYEAASADAERAGTQGATPA